MGNEPGRDELLEQLTESTSDVLWMFSRDWEELIFVNPAYEDVWGRSIADLEEDPTDFLDGIHPEDRADVEDAMERLSAGESVEIEYRVNADEGYGRWVRVQGDPVYDDGEVVRVMGVASDVTERKAREARLTRYKTILGNVPDGVYLFDGDLELTFANRAAIENSVLPREELLGRELSDLLEATMVDGPPIDGIVSIYEELISGERGEFRETIPFETSDGTRPFDARAARGEDADGEFVGVVSVLRDITARVEAERELRRQNERLDEFASVLSHDLRNPLNVARGNLEFVREEYDHDRLDTVAEMLDRMETLIEDVLALVREDETVEEAERVELSEMARRCWRSIEDADAELVAGDDLAITANRSRLAQVLENLFRNAVEHGSTPVTIHVGPLDDGSGFYVEDDGPGIPADERERVFDPGYSTDEKGTGFGLNIVQAIAESHGWDVRVREGTDGGARIEVTGVEISDG